MLTKKVGTEWKRLDEIKKGLRFRNHYIICGGGRIGERVGMKTL